MYSSRLQWAIVNEDRHCGARRRRARIPWSIEVDHGPAWSRTSSMRDVAGICWNLLDQCWNLLDTAGHRTPRAGHCGRAAAATDNTITMASESICSVMTPDQTSSPPRIHHRRPSAHVLGAAVVYFDATHPNVVEIKQ